MMKRIFILSLVFVIIFAGAGCKKIKKPLLKKPASQKEVVTKVESVDLAEAILRPKPYQFSLPRDPFKPLFGKMSLLSGEEEALLEEDKPKIKVTGILFKKGNPLALLESSSGEVGLFKQGDKIEKYTVKKIETKKVILEREDKTFILEIEEEK